MIDKDLIIKQLEYKAKRYEEAANSWRDRYSNLLLHGKEFSHLFYVDSPGTYGAIILVLAKTKMQVVELVNKHTDSLDWVTKPKYITFDNVKEICFDENPIVEILTDEP